MYDWSYSINVISSALSCFSCCWKDVRLKHCQSLFANSAAQCFSCCWKDVRLKRNLHAYQFGCARVSVVVERMYDWSSDSLKCFVYRFEFQLLLKGCTIEAATAGQESQREVVSVVVERMYDWSSVGGHYRQFADQFQLLLKGCTIEAEPWRGSGQLLQKFQLLLKGCTIEAVLYWRKVEWIRVSVVVERMYDWSSARNMERRAQSRSFSCCWKDVRLKLNRLKNLFFFAFVSVVVERMYDWSLSGGQTMLTGAVSVVVERMYDWSTMKINWSLTCPSFSCCWKDVRLKLENKN